MDPERIHAHRLLGAVLLLTGLHTDALAALETALTIMPDDPITIAWLAHARAAAGDRRNARSLVERLDKAA